MFAIGIIFGMTYLNLSGYTITGKSVGKKVEENESNDIESQNIRDSTRLNPNELLNDSLDEPDTDIVKREFSPTGEKAASARVDKLAQKQAFERADRYLVAGNYPQALENYYDFEKFAGESGSAILLREAFCCEMQSRFDRAEEKYYNAISRASGESHRLIGIAGLARCLSKKGNRRDALDMLAEQNLKIDHFVGLPDEVRAQIVYQFAKVLEMYAVGDQVDLTLSNSVAFENIVPKTEVFLNTIDDPGIVTQSTTSKADLKLTILQRPSESLTVISAAMSAKLEPIDILLGHIAAEADQTLLMSEQAQLAISNRSRTIELQSTPLSSVLDQLLAPLGLVWFQVDSELHIVSQQEVDPKVAPRQFWFDTAHRAYRRFEIAFDDDRRRHASMLSRANMSLIQNQLDAASNQYQELTQVQPIGEVLAKLFFNSAKLNLLLDRKDNANRLLYLAVDQTQIPEIQASGFCLLGESLLSSGDLEASIKISRRGLATAINDKQKRMASLNLARAYLLNDDPFMANKQLFDNREFYADTKSKSVASILGAYARFIGVRDENGIRLARNRLLSAVTMVPEKNYQMFVDAYMAGLAYERMGFREKAVDKLLLSLTLPGVGSWKRQILFEMGVLQSRLERPSESAIAFEAVIQPEDDAWNRLAMEKLAKIYLDSGQPQKCIDVCKKLWVLPLAEPRKKSVLQILGDAFSEKGEHYTAALCFAGMVPDQF